MELVPKVNANYAEDSINRLLSRYSASTDEKFVAAMFDEILAHLNDSSGVAGQRVWIKININRVKAMLENDDLESAGPLIDQLTEKLASVSDITKNSYALDVIAAEVEYAMKSKKLLAEINTLYRESAGVNTAITHPKVLGVLKECGAMLQFYIGHYDKARVGYYESFKSYDEAGSSSKRRVLKYLTLCAILTESEVNLFESQETQSYAQHPEFQGLMRLAEAYEKQSFPAFAIALQEIQKGSDSLSTDRMFLHLMNIIEKKLRQRILRTNFQAFSSVKFDSLLDKLSLNSDNDLIQLVLGMAREGLDLHGARIDFTNRVINMRDKARATRPLLLTPLDGHRILRNIAVLRALSIPNGELRSKKSLFRMVPSNKDSGADSDYDFDEWLSWMRSLLPRPAKEQISHKEQVLNDQRAQKAAKEDDMEADVDVGILGGTLAVPEEEEESDDEVPDKLDVAEQWMALLCERLSF